MDNLPRIKSVSKKFYYLFSILLIAVPLFHVLFWIFINHIPDTLITVSSPQHPLSPHELSLSLRLLGLLACLLPLSAEMYGLTNLKKVFAFYKEGIIFSYEQVTCFKKIGKALLLWTLFNTIYDSASGVIFTLGNPPGERVLEVGFTSVDFTALTIGGIILVISWVMDEGRKLNEEQALTV